MDKKSRVFENEEAVLKAAEDGNLEAIQILALSAELGLSSVVKGDQQEYARLLWKKAAEMGSGLAVVSLANMLEKGVGGSRDEKAAAVLFKRASRYGYFKIQEAAEHLRKIQQQANQLAILRVLIVDDSDDSNLLAELLEKRRFTVSKVRNGLEALNVLHTHPDVKIIFTEINLSIMGGLELLKRLRTSDFKHIPCLVFSKNASKENILEFRSLGIAGWLVKSANQGKLDDILGKVPAVKKLLKYQTDLN